MTIKDIAKLADVSVSTVSRVLNDRPDVSEDSRRRVRAVIEAHRYLVRSRGLGDVYKRQRE